MKSLQYTVGIMFGVFLTISSKQDFYSKYILPNSMTMSYSLEINLTTCTRCALLCLSTEDCSYFHWYNRSCYIPNPASPGNSSVVTVKYIYVHRDLKDNCNIDGYNTIFGGVLCVGIYHIPMNWTDAKTTCEQGGGQLLVMRTSVFYIKLEALKTLYPLSEEYWIGGTDLTTEGVFTWTDGSDVTTEGWEAGNPNNYNGNEDCLQFKHLELNDNNCGFTRYFLCEKPLL